jgi:hypothetical protein
MKRRGINRSHGRACPGQSVGESLTFRRRTLGRPFADVGASTSPLLAKHPIKDPAFEGRRPRLCALAPGKNKVRDDVVRHA